MSCTSPAPLAPWYHQGMEDHRPPPRGGRPRFEPLVKIEVRLPPWLLDRLPEDPLERSRFIRKLIEEYLSQERQ